MLLRKISEGEVITLVFIVALLFFVVKFGHAAPPPSPIRLIGINCQGAGGDLWAVNEDDFPGKCQKIERWPS